MFKKLICSTYKTAVVALLVTAPTAPIYAQAEAETSEVVKSEEQKMLDLFAEIFSTDDLPPIAPARLALAEKTAASILPDGSFAKIMNGIFDKMLEPLLKLAPEMSANQIMAATGIYDDNVEELDQEKRKAITDLLDPDREEKMAKTIDAAMPILNEALAELEPAMRKGLARAYARKFSAAQLTELNRFFATPTGSAYAAESYALQADPEVLQSTFSALPAMMEKLMASAPAVAEKMKDIPKAKTVADLNDGELEKLAGLMGVNVAKLEEGKKMLADGEEAATDAAAGPAYAVEGTSGDYDTGEEPWYDDTNWTEEERASVKKMSDKHDAEQAQASEAYSLWETAYDEIASKYRKKYKADGWKPEAGNE